MQVCSGHAGEAHQVLDLGLDIKERHCGKNHFDLAATLGSIGNAHGAVGNPDKRRQLLERALPIKERHYGKDHVQLAVALANLGNAHVREAITSGPKLWRDISPTIHSHFVSP